MADEELVRHRAPAPHPHQPLADRANRFRRVRAVLTGITALAQIPFALGVGTLLSWLRVPGAWAFAALAAVLSVLPLQGRLARGISDRPLPPWKLLLVEEPYYAHWFATVLSVPLFVL